MKEHIQILELASRNELPDKIDRTSGVSLQATRELVDAGHLTGISANSLEGHAIISPAITLPGRQFLIEQQKKKGFMGFVRSVGPLLKWIAGLAATVLAAWLIKVIVEK